MRFQEMRAPELRELDRERVLIVAPLAAVEQHGPHLPTGTDQFLVSAVAEALEETLSDHVLLLPTTWLGASQHHLPLGATLTATLEGFSRGLCELAEPLLADGFRRLFFLNGHGGNTDPMKVALRQLQVCHPGALLAGGSYWSLAEQELAALMEGQVKTLGHADEAETSLMLHLRPELVDGAGENQDDYLPDEVGGIHVCRDMKQRTRIGITGRSDLATAAKGRAMFEAIVSKSQGKLGTLLEMSLPEAHGR